MKFNLNFDQRKEIASFWSNLAVAWFVAAFLPSGVTSELDFMAFVRYIGSGMGALLLSLYYLKEKK